MMDMFRCELAVKMGKKANLHIHKVVDNMHLVEELVPAEHYKCFSLLKDSGLYYDELSEGSTKLPSWKLKSWCYC